MYEIFNEGDERGVDLALHLRNPEVFNHELVGPKFLFDEAGEIIIAFEKFYVIPRLPLFHRKFRSRGLLLMATAVS